MAKRGICVRTESIEKVKSALIRNGYTTQRALAEAAEMSLSTVRKFLKGENISRANFLDLCERLGLDFEEVANLGSVSPPAVTKETIAPLKTTPNSPQPQQYWGEAPDVSEFYGRTEELETLQQWITVDKCRLIALLGMGGIGKTALSVKLAKTVARENHFQFIIWRSLRESPPVEKIVTDLIKILSCQQETDLPDSLGEKITKLIGYLNSSRCLVVLDNAESILQDGTQAGCYRQGYEGYGTLLRRLGNTSHQSCVLITSREKPTEIAASEGETRLVRTLPVLGLTKSVQKILKAKGISGSAAEMARLTEVYSGNPLAINIVATSIQDLFGGNLATFLAQETTIFSDVERLLDSQFNRLGDLEEGIMYWLAINREPVSWEGLQDDILFHYPTISQLTESLQGLRRRSLIERVEDGFTLQNVVMEYMTQKLITGVREEIISPARITSASLCHRYALMKATAKDYVRKTQIRLIVQPVVEGIRNIEARLQGLLEVLRSEFGGEASYGAGNVLNLLNYLHVDMSGYDFSGLSIWQAYLQGRVLHDVNFTHVDFSKSVFTKTFGAILCVAFSPNGKFLAAGDANGEIRLWQVSNWQPVLTLQGNIYSYWVRSIAFSPDSTIIASSSNDQTIKLWNINTGHCLQTSEKHHDWVSSVSFSPNGKILASASDDKTIKLWDVKTGQCLQILQGHEDGLNWIAFSPDSLTLCSASDDETIKLWDIKTGQCLKTLEGHTRWVYSIAFSLNGENLISGSQDGTIKIWDTKTGQCLQSLENHSVVYSIAVNCNGEIASGDQAQRVRIWDWTTGQCLKTLEDHTSWVSSVVFSPDGKTLASASPDQTVKLWNCDLGECVTTLRGHDNLVKLFAFSSNSRIIASVSNEGHVSKTIRIWDISTGTCLNILRGHKEFIRSIVFHPNDEMLASAGNDKKIRFWDIKTGQCIKILQGNTEWIWSLAFSPNGKIVVSGNGNNTIKIWDIITGECINTLEGHNDAVLSVAISPDGKTICSGSRDKKIKLWQLDTGLCFKTIEGNDSWIKSIEFSLDGKYFATSNITYRTTKLWRVDNFECIRTLRENTNWIKSLIFSPDGKILAVKKQGQTLTLWDINTGKEFITVDNATRLALSPNGQIIASDSNSDDETIKIWDIKTGKCLKTFRAPRPYEGTNITGVTGLNEAQKANLKVLGAIENL